MANEKRLDLIERNALKRFVCEFCNSINSDEPCEPADCRCMALIDVQPTVDAVEVVHGRWIHVPSSDMMTGKAYKCSECNKMRYGSYMPNYCQCCGAKMDGDGM